MVDFYLEFSISPHPAHINSGYTVRDGEWSVGSSPLGKGELLTLTLSFPSNRKRYQLLQLLLH